MRENSIWELLRLNSLDDFFLFAFKYNSVRFEQQCGISCNFDYPFRFCFSFFFLASVYLLRVPIFQTQICNNFKIESKNKQEQPAPILSPPPLWRRVQRTNTLKKERRENIRFHNVIFIYAAVSYPHAVSSSYRCIASVFFPFELSFWLKSSPGKCITTAQHGKKMFSNKKKRKNRRKKLNSLLIKLLCLRWVCVCVYFVGYVCGIPLARFRFFFAVLISVVVWKIVLTGPSLLFFLPFRNTIP